MVDVDGDRLFAKYYDGRKKPEQIANEALLYKKTKNVAAKSEGRLFMYLLYLICLLCSFMLIYV